MIRHSLLALSLICTSAAYAMQTSVEDILNNVDNAWGIPGTGENTLHAFPKEIEFLNRAYADCLTNARSFAERRKCTKTQMADLDKMSLALLVSRNAAIATQEADNAINEELQFISCLKNFRINCLVNEEKETPK